MANVSTESPTPPEATPPTVPPRRTFFERFGLWITGILGVLATLFLAIPLIGYLLGPIRKRRSPWVNLGSADNFPKGETRLATFDNPLRQEWDGVTANTGVYVRNLGKDADMKHQFLIFAMNCAHLGCPVSWFPQSGLFMCPCHGGVYYENGERASGPPPRGLFEVVWQVRDGNLEVQAPHYPTLHNTLRDKA
jgi:menaquinol-cytochrome c reductase iron-sulfur subunit